LFTILFRNFLMYSSATFQGFLTSENSRNKIVNNWYEVVLPCVLCVGDGQGKQFNHSWSPSTPFDGSFVVQNIHFAPLNRKWLVKELENANIYGTSRS
jgi:hypothetical protein